MTKPARLLQLVTLLGGRRPRPVRELAAHFETTERTIFRDLVDGNQFYFTATRTTAAEIEAYIAAL